MINMINMMINNEEISNFIEKMRRKIIKTSLGEDSLRETHETGFSLGSRGRIRTATRTLHIESIEKYKVNYLI